VQTRLAAAQAAPQETDSTALEAARAETATLAAALAEARGLVTSTQAQTQSFQAKHLELERSIVEQRNASETTQRELAQAQQALQLSRNETAQAQAQAQQAYAQAQQAQAQAQPFVPVASVQRSEISQRGASRGGNGFLATSGGSSGDLYDAEGGGGLIDGAGGKFEPLVTKIKQLGQNAPALRNKHVLRAAGTLDKASGYLHKRPLWRLGLLVYVLFVHLLWLLF
jgi:cobalamin biosynthesis Mg chelatase CobN